MEGLVELAEEIFHQPVRLGLPHTISGLVDVVRNPIYSTGVGLLQFGYRHASELSAEVVVDGSFFGLWDRMRSWFQGNF